MTAINTEPLAPVEAPRDCPLCRRPTAAWGAAEFLPLPPNPSGVTTATDTAPAAPVGAPRGCPRCPRLVAYREANRRPNPEWIKGPVALFGDSLGRLVVV